MQSQTNKQRWKKWMIGDWSRRRMPLRVVRLLVEVYLGVLVFAWLFSDRLAFRPPSPTYTEGNGVCRIVTQDGNRLAVLALPNAAASPVVLFAHGNGEDLGGIRGFLDAYRAAGFEVYAFDYRGYGISDGKPGTGNAYEDIQTVYRYLVEDKRIDPNRIILHGRSLGSGIALHLATRCPVRGVILESAFLTAFRALTQIPLLPIDKMRNDREIRILRRPVLFIHGEDDQTVKCWQGKKLFSEANEPKFAYWVAHAGHNDVFDTAPVEYWKRIRTFANFAMETN